MEVRIKIGLAKTIFETCDDAMIEKLKRGHILDSFMVELGKLYDSGYIQYKSKFSNGENDINGVEYELGFVLLNEAECAKIRFKNK